MYSPGFSAYGCGKLRSPCGTSPLTILAMTRAMREAIPGSRSSLGAAKAGVERATSNKATETVLFDMISSNVFQGSHHRPRRLAGLRMWPAHVGLRNEDLHDSGDDVRNARG